jgi:hypothetical protein
MSVEIITYLVYLAISVALTIWVAHTLHKNGRIFLVDVFTAMSPWRIPLIICWWLVSI